MQSCNSGANTGSCFWGTGLEYSQEQVTARRGCSPISLGCNQEALVALASNCGSGFPPEAGQGPPSLLAQGLSARKPRGTLVHQLTTAATPVAQAAPPGEGVRS